MRRMLWTSIGVAVASFLLAGCQMNVITKIDSSGAGTLTTEVGMTPDEVAQLQSLGGDSGGEPCAALSSNATGAAEAPAFVQEMRGEETWCVSAVPFADVDELAALYQQMDFVQIRELTLREGLVVYDLELDTQASAGALPAGAMSWILELPGKLGTHNADSVDGKRLTWTLKPGTVTEVKASSDLSALSLPFGLGGPGALIIAAIACAACAGILVLVIVAIVLVIRRKHSAPASSAAPGPLPPGS